MHDTRQSNHEPMDMNHKVVCALGTINTHHTHHINSSTSSYSDHSPQTRKKNANVAIGIHCASPAVSGHKQNGVLIVATYPLRSCGHSQKGAWIVAMYPLPLQSHTLKVCG